ncbi:MAG: hypothetical protein CMN76_04485 [Spirochaetaceae bacterium]|nr:hypothetical protein [Spirochaetaceae bacterium]|tara:strand:- start:371685 stop:372830 length:1146 start_codon:yes stop_codon:yes gene_type:complete
MKKVILITFLLISLLLAGIGTFVYLPTIIQGLDFSSADFRKISLVDHAERDKETLWIQTAELMVPEDAKGYVLIVPDRDYDRDWNSPGNQTRPGLRFARRLVERNMAVIRYSPPGSADETIDLVDPDKSTEALLAVIQAFENWQKSASQPDLPVTVLTIGEGCIVAVTALQRTETLKWTVDRLMLGGCAYSSTLLSGWAGRVFYNMELSGASEETMNRAQEIWKSHKKEIESGAIPELDEEAWEERLEELRKAGLSADLQAFEKTLSHLYKPENRSWTRRAAHLEFLPLLESLRQARPDMKIIHLLGQYDEEIHPVDRDNQENLVRSGPISNYQFVYLERTDHGFVVRDSPPASPVENMMRRRDPFAEFSPTLLDLIAGQP